MFQYRQFDGRQNIRVGNGRFYSRGRASISGRRTIEVECNFPSNMQLVSNIVWVRKAFQNRDYYPRLYILGYPFSGIINYTFHYYLLY